MFEEIAKYSVIIFDLDGTLIDLSINWEELRIELEQKFHYPFRPFFKSFENLSRETKEKVLQILQKHEQSGLLNSKPNERMKYLVRDLARKNKKLAVFSSNSNLTIEQTLNNMGLRGNFNIIIGCEDVEKHKPHPEGLFLILKHFKVLPSQVVYIGNDLKDFEAATRSGIQFYFVNQVNPDE
ncbi:MAG: HAD family hydrolase [Candidatus Hodarchaeota archaeon]